MPAPAAPAPASASPAPAAPAAPAAAPGAGGEKTGQLTQPPPKGATSTAQGDGQQWFLPIFIGGLFLMFWLLILRPQQKREKTRQQMLSKLKVGERVMTGGGIIGEIVELTDEEASLRIDPRKDVRMRVRRAAIVGPAGEPGSEQAVKEGMADKG